MQQLVITCDLCKEGRVINNTEHWYSLTKNRDLGDWVQQEEPSADTFDFILCVECKWRLSAFYRSAKQHGIKIKRALESLEACEAAGLPF